MKKIGKRNANKFVKIIEDILIENGFVSQRCGDFILITGKYGGITFRPDNSPESELYSIYGKFLEPEIIDFTGEDDLIGNYFYQTNPYSGKCNFHNSDMDNIIKHFKQSIEQLKNL